jgi:hypothetical protein
LTEACSVGKQSIRTTLCREISWERRNIFVFIDSPPLDFVKRSVPFQPAGSLNLLSAVMLLFFVVSNLV